MRFWLLKLCFLFCIVLAAATFTVRAIHFLQTPLVPEGAQLRVTLHSGESLTAFAKQLQARGILTHPRYFIWLARLRDQAHQLKAGVYEFQGPLGPAALLDQLVAGDTIESKLTIIDGWTFLQMRQAIDATADLTHTTRHWSDTKLMQALGHGDQFPEGRFYPDTYHYTPGMSDLRLYQVAYETLAQHLQKAWDQRAQDLPYSSRYQALIAASLIEKETALPAERSQVAGVLVRRLRKGMLLQFDPTVIYGIGPNFNGDITRANLRDQKNKYNTYIYKGLPPTPIALPSQGSIWAAVHPAAGKSLYFVADGSGGHIFSDTLAQHQRAVRRYLKQLKP